MQVLSNVKHTYKYWHNLGVIFCTDLNTFEKQNC